MLRFGGVVTGAVASTVAKGVTQAVAASAAKGQELRRGGRACLGAELERNQVCQLIQPTKLSSSLLFVLKVIFFTFLQWQITLKYPPGKPPCLGNI